MGAFQLFHASRNYQAERDRDRSRQDWAEASLDAVTSCVMITDCEYRIIKVNRAAIEMLRRAEEDIRQLVSDFTVDRLEGSSMDIFHRHSEHQRRILDNLSGPHQASITIGSRSFNLIASPMFDAQGARLGTVVEWVDMTDDLARRGKEHALREKAEKMAEANARIKAALDSVSTNVMMADENNIIIYANDAVKGMLRKAEADLRKALPHFSADTVVGSSVDVFHRNPAHQRHIMAQMRDTHRASIKIGGRSFILIANPVFSEDGGRLGTVVEWQDRTEELAFEERMGATIEKAVEGDIHSRIDSKEMEGFLQKTADSINSLLDTFSSVLSEAGTSVKALARGDLTRKIDLSFSGAYEDLRQDINLTIDKLQEVVGDIARTSSSVREGSEEIASGNSLLSQRTEEQASRLEETSAAMEEITTTVQQNAESSSQASQLAKQACETAESGGGTVAKAVDSMKAITDSSQRIMAIITVIDEIAFQTNLLSLNAAVEAARAGEHGRGFAVVAEEVRALAGRSASAAKEIKGLIDDSVTKVEEGARWVNDSGKSLDQILSAVRKVNDIVSEISLASQEQASGLEEMNQAVAGMDSMTQQNAAMVEEAAAASEALGEQAAALDRLIDFFQTGNGASGP